MSDTTLINTSIKSMEEIANVENDPNYWRELTPEEANLLCQLATELQSIGIVLFNNMCFLSDWNRLNNTNTCLEKQLLEECSKDQLNKKKRAKTLDNSSSNSSGNNNNNNVSKASKSKDKKKKKRKTVPHTPREQDPKPLPPSSQQQNHRRRNKGTEEFYSLVWFWKCVTKINPKNREWKWNVSVPHIPSFLTLAFFYFEHRVLLIDIASSVQSFDSQVISFSFDL